MSRSQYSDDLTSWALICWRGAVASAIRGKRGQGFLRELRDALDALPEKKLIAHDLQRNGEVCAIGAVGLMRHMDMSSIDVEEPEQVAAAFGIPRALAAEIEFINDEASDWLYLEKVEEAAESRFARVRKWVVEQIK